MKILRKKSRFTLVKCLFLAFIISLSCITPIAHATPVENSQETQEYAAQGDSFVYVDTFIIRGYTGDPYIFRPFLSFSYHLNGSEVYIAEYNMAHYYFQFRLFYNEGIDAYQIRILNEDLLICADENNEMKLYDELTAIQNGYTCYWKIDVAFNDLVEDAYTIKPYNNPDLALTFVPGRYNLDLFVTPMYSSQFQYWVFHDPIHYPQY